MKVAELDEVGRGWEAGARCAILARDEQGSKASESVITCDAVCCPEVL